MDILLSNASSKPLYEQIVEQIKRAIMQGEVQEGDALPSMRVLAKELRISVITTKRAYEELEREGFIVTMTGKGSFVAGKNREMIREEHLKQAEEHLQQASTLAKRSGIALEELQAILQMIYEEQ